LFHKRDRGEHSAELPHRETGVGRHYYRLPKSRALRSLFLQYLKKQYELSPWFVYTYHILNQTGILFQKSVLWIFRPNLKDRRSTIFWPDLDISFLLWIWVTHLLAQRMGHILHGDVEALHDNRKCDSDSMIFKH